MELPVPLVAGQIMLLASAMGLMMAMVGVRVASPYLSLDFSLFSSIHVVFRARLLRGYLSETNRLTSVLVRIASTLAKRLAACVRASLASMTSLRKLHDWAQHGCLLVMTASMRVPIAR